MLLIHSPLSAHPTTPNLSSSLYSPQAPFYENTTFHNNLQKSTFYIFKLKIYLFLLKMFLVSKKSFIIFLYNL
jgi:hypothetical protein